MKAVGNAKPLRLHEQFLYDWEKMVFYVLLTIIVVYVGCLFPVIKQEEAVIVGSLSGIFVVFYYTVVYRIKIIDASLLGIGSFLDELGYKNKYVSDDCSVFVIDNRTNMVVVDYLLKFQFRSQEILLCKEGVGVSVTSNRYNIKRIERILEGGAK